MAPRATPNAGADWRDSWPLHCFLASFRRQPCRPRPSRESPPPHGQADEFVGNAHAGAGPPQRGIRWISPCPAGCFCCRRGVSVSWLKPVLTRACPFSLCPATLCAHPAMAPSRQCLPHGCRILACRVITLICYRVFTLLFGGRLPADFLRKYPFSVLPYPTAAGIIHLVSSPRRGG